jgi:hypothetical protein
MHTTIYYALLPRHTFDFDHVHQLHNFAEALVGTLADSIRNGLGLFLKPKNTEGHCRFTFQAHCDTPKLGNKKSKKWAWRRGRRGRKFRVYLGICPPFQPIGRPATGISGFYPGNPPAYSP